MSELYYHTTFALVLLTCLMIPDRKSCIYTQSKRWCIFLLLLAVLCIGLLPVPWNSGADRELYAASFMQMSKFEALPSFKNDALFGIYQWVCGLVLNYHVWFLLTSLIYVGNHYLMSQELGERYAFPLFLMFCTGFLFYAYGTNTLRAGLAASFLLLALIHKERLFLFIICLLTAINIHFSMALPALCMVIAKYYNNSRLYIGLWGFSVILSAAMGSTFEALFAQLIPDQRTSYLMVAAGDTHYKVGFRIDFILYSLAPIAMGWYYIVKKGIHDKTYSLLFNTYILANTFWVLVIRANFSDRFAYLSWFLYPVVLIYPALKYQIWKNHHGKLALIVFLHASFTYLMFIR